MSGHQLNLFKNLKGEIQHLAHEYGIERNSLIPILQGIQRKYRYIPTIAEKMVAEVLSVDSTTVHSTVTFYSFLREEPKGRFTIRVCCNHRNESQQCKAILKELKSILKIQPGETTRDGLFSLEESIGIFLDYEGPVLLVNHIPYTHITPRDIYQIIHECRNSMAIPQRDVALEMEM